MGTARLAQIPDPDIPIAITADKLTLIRVNDHIIDRRAMDVVPLYTSTSCIPDLDCVIFRTCDHPFSLAVESYTSNIACMTFECENGVRVAGLDVVEFDVVVACSG